MVSSSSPKKSTSPPLLPYRWLREWTPAAADSRSLIPKRPGLRLVRRSSALEGAADSATATPGLSWSSRCLPRRDRRHQTAAAGAAHPLQNEIEHSPPARSNSSKAADRGCATLGRQRGALGVP